MLKRYLLLLSVCFALAVFIFFDVKVYLNVGGESDAAQSPIGELGVVYKDMSMFCDTGGDLLVSLKKYEGSGNFRCFERALKFNSSYDSRVVDEYLINLMDEGGAFSVLNVVRLAVLRFLIPRVVAGKVGFNYADYYAYVRGNSESPMYEIQGDAIEVLSYYKRTDDIQLFRKKAMTADGYVFEKSVFALLTMCTEGSKIALTQVFSERDSMIMKEEYAWVRKAIKGSQFCGIK